MSLSKYHSKRKFDQTSEPAGTKTPKTNKFRFVVQEHHARNLHYDFRLELDGVLKSWAVPKGISLSPHDHHLAIATEDHPLEYITFHGKIPEGNYGAGTVKIFDSGTYEPRDEDADCAKAIRRGLRAGHLTFILHGKKLKGEFALIKNEHFGKDSWLIIKKGDEFSKPAGPKQPEIVRGSKPAQTKAKAKNTSLTAMLSSARKSRQLKQVNPMLATLVDEAFDGKDWLFEIKWDGYRAITSWDGKKSELYSRNQTDFKSYYPEVLAAVEKIDSQVVLDGEIVAVDAKGQPHFEWLQSWRTQPQGELRYYVFDILWCDGRDLRDLPLSERRHILTKIIPSRTLIHLSDGVVGKGASYFSRAARLNLEGIMAKRLDSSYLEAKRGKNWLKIKTHLQQEVVIGGFTEPRGGRKDLGSILVGTYEKGKLQYRGHVGTGMDTAVLKDLRKKLMRYERKSSPFENAPKANDVVHWIAPKLIAEVKFAEWTSAGTMRQPVYMGLRPDKKPSQVVRETPVRGGQYVKSKMQNVASNNKSKPRAELEITHRDKIFWPEAKLTKGDLLQYYETVAKTLLPYLKDRPESLLRQPDGYKGQAFFQKDIAQFVPSWAKTSTRHSDSAGKDITYLVCNDVKTLSYMVQLGCIEINPWNSRIQNPAKPDWAIIDLDPEGIGFEKVIEVAQTVKAVCDELKIKSYPKTSGKTGIHIFIPLGAKYSYDQSRQFALLVATLVHEKVPKITSLERQPKKRQHKIYLDYLQNSEGQTLAAPYCVRPTKAASVSAPLHWSEVKKGLRPEDFTMQNMPARIKKVGDLFKPVLGSGVDIAKVLKNAKL